MNGKELLNELDFDKKIKTKPDRELLEFIAEQVYDICKRCDVEDKRITYLEDNRLPSVEKNVFRITIALVALVVGSGGGIGIFKLLTS